MSMKAQILFLFSIYCFLIGSTPVMKAQTGKFYSTDKELSNSLMPYIRTGKDLSG